jgi:Ca2+-binding EF-hand superfamily protein
MFMVNGINIDKKSLNDLFSVVETTQPGELNLEEFI